MISICSVDQIEEGKARSFEHAGKELIVAKQDGEIYVYLNQCPHLQIPLNWQPDDFMDADGELLQCSTHGALFLVKTGECISGPCVGDALAPYPCRIEDNQVKV